MGSEHVALVSKSGSPLRQGCCHHPTRPAMQDTFANLSAGCPIYSSNTSFLPAGGLRAKVCTAGLLFSKGQGKGSKAQAGSGKVSCASVDVARESWLRPVMEISFGFHGRRADTIDDGIPNQQASL